MLTYTHFLCPGQNQTKLSRYKSGCMIHENIQIPCHMQKRKSKFKNPNRNSILLREDNVINMLIVRLQSDRQQVSRCSIIKDRKILSQSHNTTFCVWWWTYIGIVEKVWGFHRVYLFDGVLCTGLGLSSLEGRPTESFPIAPKSLHHWHPSQTTGPIQPRRPRWTTQILIGGLEGPRGRWTCLKSSLNIPQAMHFIHLQTARYTSLKFRIVYSENFSLETKAEM